MPNETFLRIEKLIKAKVDGYDQWGEIPLGIGTIRIARPTSEPDSVAPDIRIIGDDYISRKPVEISYSPKEQCYILRDNGTANGTFLNEELIENDGRPYHLKDYDLIGLAKIRGEVRVLFRFRLTRETLPGWIDEDRHRHPATKGLAVNLASRDVFVDGTNISLTPTEWKLFEFLYTNRGKVCSVDDIAWEVWGQEGARSELVAKYIQRLRSKIEVDRSKPRYLKTHSTSGYVLDI